MVFILGEIFEVESKKASELLEISATNFRQILSRSRKDLYNFMNNKCGLLKAENPCRCSKKTKELIQAGKVNADNTMFNVGFVNRISEVATERANQSESVIEEKYAFLFKEHPFYNKDKSHDVLKGILRDDDIKTIFDL